jgi:hypothetical protein
MVRGAVPRTQEPHQEVLDKAVPAARCAARLGAWGATRHGIDSGRGGVGRPPPPAQLAALGEWPSRCAQGRVGASSTARAEPQS